MITQLIGTLGGRLAERWAGLAALPGLLYVAVAVVAGEAGQHAWYPPSDVLDRLTADERGAAGRGAAATLLVAFLVLVAATGAALAVRAAGGVVERLWTAEGTSLLTERRRVRYHAALRAAQNAHLAAAAATPADRPPLVRAAERAYAARDRIALYEPDRLTWIGDRLAAADRRVHTAYDLDLTSAWPRLWLILPDGTRSELARARAEFAGAAQLVGWAVGYLLLAVWWWPASLLGCAVALVGWRRGRGCADVLAVLVEAAVDVHGGALAREMGFDCPGRLTRRVGEELSRALRTEG